jgi:hypothetical protein
LRRLVALVAGLAALASSALALTPRETWNLPAEPFHVIGDVYYVGMHGLSSWLIVTPSGDILIDGDLPESAPFIERHIRQLGFQLKDVKIISTTSAGSPRSSVTPARRSWPAPATAPRWRRGPISAARRSSRCKARR